jgi:hypothetical protein
VRKVGFCIAVMRRNATKKDLTIIVLSPDFPIDLR